jgi:TPR repeat protein
MFKSLLFKNRLGIGLIIMLAFMLGGWDAQSMEGEKEESRESPISKKKAYEQWLVEATKKLSLAEFKVGMRLIGSKEYGEASSWIKNAAWNGNVSAQYNLGLMYQKGCGVSKNDIEAKKWFKIAKKNGHPKAKKSLSEVRYNIGRDVSKKKD